MKNIKKIASYSMVGGFGAILVGGILGCQNSEEYSQNAQNGAFVIIQETSPGKYKVKEEFPSDKTRIVLEQLDGTEKVLTKQEMDALMAEENAKIDAGTSNLTNQNAQISSGGFSLGEAILASAAGALIGSWIGNKLFNNQTFQNQRQTAYKNPSTYSRSVDSFNKAKQSQTSGQKSGKSGFFGGKKSSTGTSSFGG